VGTLRCIDLCVTFRTRTRQGIRTVEAVKGVNLEVAPDRVIGIVGESGSGKTTVARAMVGLQRPTSGQVFCRDAELTGTARKENRELIGRNIGMIFQDPRSSLNPRLSVQSVIADPLVVHKIGSRQSRAETVNSLLDDVGLPRSVARRRVRTLSGGQLQRVAIARALCLNPAFIVADEPTSALDVSVQAQILNLLRELKTRHHFGMLIISHDMRVMRALTDEIVVMLNGDVVERGATADIFTAASADYTRALIAATPLLSRVNTSSAERSPGATQPAG
jgi:peptide/nickel transport system ATP-binding protein